MEKLEFIYPENDPKSVHIFLKDGPFEGTVYKYGGVRVEEKNGEAHLLFNFSVIYSPQGKPKKLEKDEHFRSHVGKILHEMINNAHEEQDGSDETGTNHFKESGL